MSDAPRYVQPEAARAHEVLRERFRPTPRAEGLREAGFAADRPTGPRTRDGHALASRMRRADPEVDWDAWVRTIEDQAAALAASDTAPGLDVERLFEAFTNVNDGHGMSLAFWHKFAAEYARLASPDPTDKPRRRMESAPPGTFRPR